jgi:glycosyltransferase involved in cell wall biosynthesis
MLAYGEQFAGAERQIVTLCRELLRAGAAVEAYLQYDALLAAHLRDDGVPVTHVGALNARDAIARLATPPLPGRRSVFHAHNARSSMLASRACLRSGMPVVKTEHGSPSPPGLRPARLKARVARLLETLALRTARAQIVFVSEDLRRAAAWCGALETCVIPNGIEAMDRGTIPRPAEFDAAGFQVVYAGRLEPVKAPLAAIEAALSLPEDLEATLWVLGDGPLRAAAEQSAASELGRRRVRLLGFRPDARAFLAHADAAVMPSLHEGLPFTALEALSLGTPLIAANVGGLREMLVHDESALLVGPGDSAGVREGIVKLARDRALGRRLADGGRRVIANRLSSEAMARRYLEVYERALASVTRARR